MLEEKGENSSLVKLALNYSITHLTKQKKILESKIQKQKKVNNKNIENEEDKEMDQNLNNMNNLIKELEILINKINNYDIDISSIKIEKIDYNILHNINILLRNLLYIYYKSIYYRNFHKFLKKALKKREADNLERIDNFLEENYNKMIQGMKIIKINYASTGYKEHFYNIDNDSNTFNVRSSPSQTIPNYSYHISNDIIKITYGVKAVNLKRKLSNKKDKDTDAIKLLNFPWRIISIVTKKRSIDLYCEEDQLNNVFYGLKQFTNINNNEYKIISTNKFLIDKIKFKMVLQLKVGLVNKEIEDKDNKYNNVIKKICDKKGKGMENISFTKLMLVFSRLMNKFA